MYASEVVDSLECVLGFV